MTLRERIADWISGGALSRSWDREGDAWGKLMKEHSTATDRLMRIAWYEIALSKIAAMETPSANATVRRMAATAREALK